MNCFLFHRYGKWKIREEAPIVRSKDNKIIGKGIELRRICERCDYIKVKLKKISL